MLINVALDHFREAKRYTLTIPPSYGRLRLACLWPVLIGLETLIALAANDRWLDPACASKITRRRVYRIMGLSLPAVGSDTLVDSWIESRFAKLERAV
jgi:farnesyl-diphosphate farnesyltransferase